MKLFLLLSLSFSQLIFADQTLSASSNTYSIRGANYSRLIDQGMEFRRFPLEFQKLNSRELGFNIKKAETTSGASILFKSNSAKISISFTIPEGSENRGSDFALYINGQVKRLYSFKKTEPIQIKMANPFPGDETSYELVLPSFSNPILESFTIDDKSYLRADKSKQLKKYLAIGDSISHGVGQDSKSYKTYPFILSKKLNLQTYNLAVGGGKISLTNTVLPWNNSSIKNDKKATKVFISLPEIASHPKKISAPNLLILSI